MYYFIVNPNAGNGHGLRVWNQIRKMITNCQIRYDVFFTAKSGDATRKAREFSAGCTERTYIVAVGGDGTINDVLNGLDFSQDIVMGAVPAGSGNDFAKALGFSSGTAAIRKILTDPVVRNMDYGVIAGNDGTLERRFLVSCGTGFDAKVCYYLEGSETKEIYNKFSLGKLAYTSLGVKAFLDNRACGGSITIDGERSVEFRNIFFISIHNTPYEGGGYQFAPGAAPDDGLLNITAVSTSKKHRLLPVLVQKKRGLRENGIVRFFTCREVRVHTEEALPVHCDGELCGSRTDFSVRIVSGVLRMLT